MNILYFFCIFYRWLNENEFNQKLQYILILRLKIKIMLNSRRSFKNNPYNASKSRSKSIYRGDQSHTLSMHIRIDNDISPDKGKPVPDIQLQHKYSQKENKIQAFRESLKMNQSGNIGKRTERGQLESRSSKKLTILETDRGYKQLTNVTYRKPGCRLEKSANKEVEERPILPLSDKDQQTIGIRADQLKLTLQAIMKLTAENTQLKRQLKLMGKKGNSTVGKALRQ